jgi:hypothetical protein
MPHVAATFPATPREERLMKFKFHRAERVAFGLELGLEQRGNMP